jgi:hypothetical protein
MNSNSKQWSSATPGHILFLIDSSGSMSELYFEKGNKANFTGNSVYKLNISRRFLFTDYPIHN